MGLGLSVVFGSDRSRLHSAAGVVAARMVRMFTAGMLTTGVIATGVIAMFGGHCGRFFAVLPITLATRTDKSQASCDQRAGGEVSESFHHLILHVVRSGTLSNQSPLRTGVYQVDATSVPP